MVLVACLVTAWCHMLYPRIVPYVLKSDINTTRSLSARTHSHNSLRPDRSLKWIQIEFNALPLACLSADTIYRIYVRLDSLLSNLTLLNLLTLRKQTQGCGSLICSFCFNIGGWMSWSSFPVAFKIMNLPILR